MGYEAALQKSWQDLAQLGLSQSVTVKFLADDFSIDIGKRKVLFLANNTQAKDFTAILLLHYLAQRLRGLPSPTGEWLTFRELAGVEGYGSAFRKRCIEPIIRKYASNPADIFSVLEKLPAKKTIGADVALVIEALEKVSVMVKLWKADEDFGSDANMLFDRSIRGIFCIEDIVVLAGIIAGQL